ncbi:MAG TPA: hypothetical protein VKY37_03050 [Brumimicrobium sp.]|nr:hypothetical protein [Brumimicrobium sp.]
MRNTPFTKFSLLFLFSLFLFSSCAILFPNNNYTNLSSEQQSNIIKLKTFEDVKPGFVYEITGDELLNELKKQDKSMVYYFANSCPSHSKNHLYEEKKYAEENGFKLFLIMYTYDNMNSTLQKDLDLPVFSVNSDTYGISNSRKYYKKFKEDVGYYSYKETLNGKWPGRYIFYEKDKIVDSKNYLTKEQYKEH